MLYFVQCGGRRSDRHGPRMELKGQFLLLQGGLRSYGLTALRTKK
ncbi:hypothetical protein FHT67_003523 [Paenibacillus sp. BK720]|nr:hypothetical protein [Paenibacillus sp. BK720]